jgi:hypothetical protein
MEALFKEKDRQIRDFKAQLEVLSRNASNDEVSPVVFVMSKVLIFA